MKKKCLLGSFDSFHHTDCMLKRISSFCSFPVISRRATSVIKLLWVYRLLILSPTSPSTSSALLLSTSKWVQLHRKPPIIEKKKICHKRQRVLYSSKANGGQPRPMVVSLLNHPTNTTATTTTPKKNPRVYTYLYLGLEDLKTGPDQKK